MWLTKTLLILCTVILLTACGNKQVDYLDSDEVQVKKISLDTDGEFAVAHMSFIHKDKGELVNTVYRVEWLDDKGATIESTSWRPLAVHGKRTIPVTERATVLGVADFRVLISNAPR